MRWNILLCVALCIGCLPVFGGIVITNTEEHQLLFVEAEKPEVEEGVQVDNEWTFPEVLDTPETHYKIGEGYRHIFVAAPGVYKIKLRQICHNWEDRNYWIDDYVVVVKVGNGPEPEPTPDPNDKPEPTPVPTLCSMVTKEQATLLVGVYSSQIQALGGSGVYTVSQFLNAREVYLEQKGLKGHGAYEVVDAKLNVVLHTLADNEVIAGSKKTELIKVLQDFADQFSKCNPKPEPKPQEGERTIIIISETLNPPKWYVDLENSLRTTEFDDYIVNRGHFLKILDPDATDAISEYTEPWIVIKDKETGKVLVSEKLPRDVSSVKTIIQAHGG